MRAFTSTIIALIVAALLLGLAPPAVAAGETTALQSFIDAQAGAITTLTARVTTVEATVAAQVSTIALHEKRIAALEAWVKAYVPPVASTKGFTILGTCSTRGCTPLPLGTTPTSTAKLGTPSTFIGPLGTASTFTGTLGTRPNPLSPHP